MKKVFKPDYTNKFNVLDASKSNLYMLIVPQIVVLLVFFLLMFAGFSVAGVTELLQKTSPFAMLKIATYIFVLIMIIRYGKKKEINIFEASNINSNYSGLKIILSAALPFALIFLISPFINLTNYLFSKIGYVAGGGVSINSDSEFLLLIIGMCFLPAIVEEIIYRGFVLKGLMQKFKPISAVLLSAFLFMIMHGSLGQTVYQFMLGVILAFVFLFGGNMIYPVVLHFVNNFIVIFVTYINQKMGGGNETPAVVTFNGLWDYVLPILLLLLAFVIVYFFLVVFKSKNKKEFMFNLKPKNLFNFKNLAINSESVNIIDSKQQNSVNLTENDFKKENINSASHNKRPKLTQTEKRYLTFTLAIGILIWLLNTLQ